MAEDKGTTRNISETAQKEEAVQAFWKDNEVFKKSLEKDAPKGEFVFYDGPPFATGLPHMGHILSSTAKDVFGRYKTMQGYFVRRRWGWDCHGLPIESKVEQKLGLKNKKEIQAIGVEKFNEEARALVLEFIHDWKRYIERLGRFVDFDNSYKTMDSSFAESVWWALSEIHKKGNLYEGRKVLMYCPHCETPLAKAEIAQDNSYKDVVDTSVTVKFKVKNPESRGLPANTYILAWTTTPWTLPGNVALAVGKDISYSTVQGANGMYIVASDLIEKSFTGETVSVIHEYKGDDLLGLEYEPLYVIDKVKAHEGKKWQVLSADFVTTEDGTGVVHTAVIYGEDDYQLGLKEGLPMVPLLNPNGTYNTDAPEFLHGQYIKKANKIIIDELIGRDLLFTQNEYKHSYPHCYRCGTALIYNAVSSWFINIQNIKQQLLEENKSINWIPSHLRDGRFGNILEGAPDWTISRNRFWATPLPIWRDTEGNITVIGSFEELRKRTKRSGNTYHVMRHGEAEQNVLGILNSKNLDKYGLTEIGRNQALASAQTLKDAGITKIFVSPLRRARETAAIVAETLGLSSEAVVIDERLRELNVGDYEEKNHKEFLEYREMFMLDYDAKIPGGESYLDARNRFGEFIYEKESKLRDEGVLIVSHGVAFESLYTLLDGKNAIDSMAYVKDQVLFPGYATVREYDFVPLPHNKNYELDVHLPYIDQIELVNERGETLTRTPEVVDCWLESGSMPFAEYNYPHKNKVEFEKRTPADFISEYIPQTRTWFYYMHVMGTMLFGHKAFKNVVTTGTVLAKDGEKMSKSKGNFTDPMDVIDVYGADVIRYFLMSGVLMQGEDVAFKDEDLKEIHAKVILLLRNVLAFYEMYKDEDNVASDSSTHILDKWILSRLMETRLTVEKAFDSYDAIGATRPMREFIDDFSTWYLRRSRERVRMEGEDRQATLSTLRYVLYELSKIVAPVIPFIAEEVYEKTKASNDVESVHLKSWSGTSYPIDEQLLEEMKSVRLLASSALKLRQEANIKVRQPLASLSITGTLSKDLADTLKDEINVKEIIMEASSLTLDTVLTSELIQEADEREKARAIADARKQLGLSPRDSVTVTYGEGPYKVELSTGSLSFDVVKNAS